MRDAVSLETLRERLREEEEEEEEELNCELLCARAPVVGPRRRATVGGKGGMTLPSKERGS